VTANKKVSVLSRYEQIALDLALRIMRNEYHRGERVSGRSTLAGRYKVSPETIRRAIALLEDAGVVETQAGTGIIIRSKRAAEDYFQAYQGEKALNNLQDQLERLQQEKKKIDREIDKTIKEMITYLWGMIDNLQYLEKFEIPEDSPLIGQTLASTRLRSLTGATVVSIERDGEETFSPPSSMQLMAWDLIAVVGTLKAKGKVKELVEGSGKLLADGKENVEG
jgi:K+/H+ antiporter YhaU regulatory subunit KhtT